MIKNHTKTHYAIRLNGVNIISEYTSVANAQLYITTRIDCLRQRIVHIKSRSGSLVNPSELAEAEDYLLCWQDAKILKYVTEKTTTVTVEN